MHKAQNQHNQQKALLLVLLLEKTVFLYINSNGWKKMKKTKQENVVVMVMFKSQGVKAGQCQSFDILQIKNPILPNVDFQE